MGGTARETRGMRVEGRDLRPEGEGGCHCHRKAAHASQTTEECAGRGLSLPFVPRDRVRNSSSEVPPITQDLTLNIKNPFAQTALKIPQNWSLHTNLHLAETESPQRPFPPVYQKGHRIYLPFWICRMDHQEKAFDSQERRVPAL